MAVKRFSPVLLLCIAAFSFATFGSASPKRQPTRRPPTEQPIGVREYSNDSFPLIQAPPPDPSSTVPENSPTSTCHTYNCNLFYQVSHTALLLSMKPNKRLQFVSIYYWPSESQNTACLASLANPPPTGTPPGLQM